MDIWSNEECIVWGQILIFESPGTIVRKGPGFDCRILQL